MRMPGVRRLLAALLALVLCLVAAGGCSSSRSAHRATPSSAAAPVVVASLETEKRLAAQGIATVGDETSTVPLVAVTAPQVLTLTRWQVSTMSAEASAGGGVLGATLDQFVPMPKGAPPVAYVIGGWVSVHASSAGDAAERAAAALFPGSGPDWRHADQVVIPTEVIALFVADFTRAALRNAPARIVTSSVLLAAGALEKPCSTVSTFVAQALSTIFDALKVDPAEVAAYVGGALGGGTVGAVAGSVVEFAATFWNKAVSFFESAAQHALSQLTAPIVHVLQLVLGGLATFTMVVSYLKSETADVRAKAPINRFAHGSEADRTGTFTADVDTGLDKDWPKAVQDCAISVDVMLPKLARPGAPVTWTVSGNSAPTLISWTPSGPQALGEDLTSTITYTTGHETQQLWDHGRSTSGTAVAHVSVRRKEVEVLKDFVTSLALGQVPRELRGLVEPIVRSWAERIAAQFEDLTSVTGSAPLVVRYEEPKDEPCTAPTGTYRGPITATLTTSESGSVLGSFAGSGTVELTYANGQLTGTIAMTGNGSVVGTGAASGGLHAVISGPAAHPVATGSAVGTGGNSPFRVPFVVTKASCASVSGDIVQLFQSVYDYYGAGSLVTVGGNGAWTIPHVSR